MQISMSHPLKTCPQPGQNPGALVNQRQTKNTKWAVTIHSANLEGKEIEQNTDKTSVD